MKLFLIGFMGSGKSVVGRKLAKRLGVDFIDMDEEIVKAAGMDIPEIFSTYGEKYFRELENKILIEVTKMDKNLVIACGGGVIEKSENREILKNQTTFFLFSPWEEIWERIKNDTNRPLVANGKVKTRQLYEKREPLYRGTGILVNTSGMTIDNIVNLLLKKIRYDNQR